MANGAERAGRGAIALAVAAALVACVAAWQAQRAARTPHDPTAPRPLDFTETTLPHPDRFWIGAWCAPPARATTAEAWTRFADAGIDVGIYPLEDRFLRADNLARLALLDSLNRARPDRRPLFAIVRDDSLHPDESLRAGWEGRLERACAAYAPYASFAGMFLADEPAWETLPTYAPTARGIASTRARQRVVAPFVNFAGLVAHPTIVDRRQWRERVGASVNTAGLDFFTADAYAAATPDGEWPNFLLTLADAATVAYARGVAFGSLIQVTGHGPFEPATPGQARMRVFEALAYGATAIVWFTYWTPNPRESPWHWRQGLVDYETGEPTAQYAMVASVNAEARRCADFWGAGLETAVAHFGGGLPAGADALAAHGAGTVPGLRAVRGGPVSIAWRYPRGFTRKLLVVNRDTERARTIELAFASPTVREISCKAFDDAPDSYEIRGPRDVRLHLSPGSAMGLEVVIPSWSPDRRP